MLVLLLDEPTGGLVARSAKPWERWRARLGAYRLDEDLARGASPETSAALALRARRLARPEFRRDLAHSAERILAEAQRPGPVHPAVPVCRERVMAAAGELAGVIDALTAPGLVPVRGVAQVSVLLADARGPLYYRYGPGDLRARLREAAGALGQPAGWPSG